MLACWADTVVVPQESCVVINKLVPFEVAALLGCAVTMGVGAVLNRARVAPGANVAVIGAGGVGLYIIIGAKLAGAKRIIAIDAAPGTETKARALGATDFVPASGNVDEQIVALTGLGADHVFEAAGKPFLQRAAIDYCRPDGR